MRRGSPVEFLGLISTPARSEFVMPASAGVKIVATSKIEEGDPLVVVTGPESRVISSPGPADVTIIHLDNIEVGSRISIAKGVQIHVHIGLGVFRLIAEG